MKSKLPALLLDFLEGFAITLSPLTMAIALAFASIGAVITKFRTTPMRNAFFLIGALAGWVTSYMQGLVPFYKWPGIWWMPTGVVVASVFGIPLTYPWKDLD